MIGTGHLSWVFSTMLAAAIYYELPSLLPEKVDNFLNPPAKLQQKPTPDK